MLASSTSAELESIGVEIENAPCALCGSGASTPMLVGRDRTCGVPGRFQIVRCDECGLVRTDPRPTRASIGRYYPTHYSPYQEEAGPRVGSGWFDRRVKAMPPVAPSGRLLEIGTSVGTFLEQRKRDGWDVTGIEFDERAAARAAERTGAPIHVGSIESASFPPGSFDVICAWQVVEHLHDPVTSLRRCFEWLVPGGWLSIAVPDIGAPGFRIFQGAWYALELPRHLYHFSAQTCRAMFESCGFSEIRLVRPRTIYTTLLSLTNVLEDRGVLARGNGRKIANSLPARVLNLGGGYVAAGLGMTDTFTMLGRKRR